MTVRSSARGLAKHQKESILSPLRVLTLVLGLALHALGQAPANGALLVVTKQSHALAIVDGASLKVLATVPISDDPHEVAVGADGRTAYISNYGDARLHTLAVVDLVGHKPLPPVDIAPLRGPHGLFLHGNTLWFTAGGSNALGTLSTVTGAVESVLGTGQDNTHLVWVSANGARIVASNAGSGTMSVFDHDLASSAALGATSGWRHTLIPVGMGAEGFAVSPDEHQLWVGNRDGSIAIIDLTQEKLAATLDADVPGANRLKYTPDGRRVLVTTHSGKDLMVFDAATRALVKRVPIAEKGASSIEIEPDGLRAFVSCPRDHIVAVVDLTTLRKVAAIDAGREPDGLAWWSRN